MSKVLISILSCVKHELNGFNQAIRDTWLPEAVKVGFDCKFFIGKGAKLQKEDSALLLENYNRNIIFQGKITEDPDISSMSVKPDHVLLDTPDAYAYSIYKFRAACQWALQSGYDHIFQALTDTFIVPERLKNSGFELYDYTGTANNERTAIGGGPGIWLSQKALQHLVNAPIDRWAYDDWIGSILFGKIKLVHDPRYTNLGPDEPPKKSNQAITSHIANTPVVYDSKVMFDLWREFEN